MTTALATAAAFDGRSAIFAGADVRREAGFLLPKGTQRPLFEDDIGDFTDVIGLPVQLALWTRRFNFTAITDPRWRLVAKELVLALFAPRHPAVVLLLRAHRAALLLRSCAGRLDELTRLFAWMDRKAIGSLQQISTQIYEASTAHRRDVLDEAGTVVGEQGPATRRAAAQVVVDLVNYRDLFTADRVPGALRPWGGATASAVAEMPSGRMENKTSPVKDSLLQPMLAAALYVVSTLGPHAIKLDREVRENDSSISCKTAGVRHGGPDFADEIVKLLAEYTRTCTPLPMLAENYADDRRADGWSADDPLLPVGPGPAGRVQPVLVEMVPGSAGAVGIRGRLGGSGEDVRPSGFRGRHGGRHVLVVLDPAAAPAPGRRAGRDRPHGRDYRSGRGLRDEGE
ncbi:hypothetical protein AB0B50_44305 [Streptomyces sp. NPDC041068]|uniref:hypothetical protein n=1 Tax=Streptomyces sp. NPDC041068 TaxID=3155130 RepID=UPI0033C0DECB